jgi:hypothetical protein
MEQAMAFDDTNFDPVKYGVLWERVQVMDKKMDKMERQLEELVGLANKSKGGFWMGMMIASGIGGIFGWITSHLKG